MKKKTAIWAIVIAFSMLFAVFPSVVAAGEFGATISEIATVKTLEGEQIKRIAILPDKNTRADVNVFSNIPGDFQVYDHKNQAIGGVVSRNEGEEYPLQIANLGNDFNSVQKRDSVRYVEVRNNTVGKFGEYNFSLSTNVFGPVGMGKSIDIQRNQYQTEVQLDIGKVGPVALVYDKQGTILQSIRDPDGNKVSIVNTRDETSAGITRRTVFIAPKKGVYSAYFTMTEKFVNLKVEDVKAKGYKLGDIIKIEDPEVKAADLPTYSKSEVSVYEMNVKEGQVIKTYFKKILGTPFVAASFPAGNGYISASLSTSGDESLLVCPKDGPVYLTVWKYLPSVDDPTPNSYRFVVSDVNVEVISIEQDQFKRIAVQPLGDDSIRVFKAEVSKAGTLLFNHTTIQNAPYVEYTDSPDSFLAYIKNNEIRSLDPILEPPALNRNHCYYHVQPGSYYFSISSTTTSGEGIVDMRIRYFADTEIELMSLAQNQVNLNMDQLQKYTLENSRNDTSPYGSTFLKVFKITMPLSMVHTLTINITGADNAAFFGHGTTLAASFSGNLFYESPYDGIHTITSPAFTSSFSIASAGSYIYSWNNWEPNFVERTYYLSLVLYRLRDAADNTNIVVDNITVNLGLGHRNSEYSFQDYDMSANIANNTVNTTIYTGYNSAAQVNGSLIKGVLWKVTGAKLFDWIQINSQRQNGQANNYQIKVYYDAPWYLAASSPTEMDYLSP
jgi:hypothetical protein